MKAQIKPSAGPLGGESDTRLATPASATPIDAPAEPAKKKARAAKPKAAPSSKTSKASPRSPRSESTAKKLICRYCGSDDLAPSFKKRRDARCRACFKKRYGSTDRDKKTTRIRK